MRSVETWVGFGLIGFSLVVGCGSGGGDDDGMAGSSNGTTGGASTGGRGGSGGSRNSGGRNGDGGTATGSGSSMGGTQSTGGAEETGGTKATGGSKATGGTSNSTGGSKSGKGGSSSGGSASKGGSASTGGSMTGGSATGGSATGGAPNTSSDVYGAVHKGQYHLGPVDFAQTEWPNACAPEGGYVASLQQATGLGGEYLAGVDSSFAMNGAACDACIVINTEKGHSIVARVVTYGAEQDPNDIDVSPSVFDTITEGEYPRSTTWQFAKCPDMGALRYEFQEFANEDWTSLWIRNARVPITKVEVKSTKHADFVALERASDGTLTDGSGFGSGAFTLRMTGMDGQVITETLQSFSPGQVVSGTAQFK